MATSRVGLADFVADVDVEDVGFEALLSVPYK